jgi:DNA primase
MRYWIDFKKLRAELSFEKVLEQYQVKLHRKGEQATCPCPLPGHTGERKTDSFSANIPKGIFQCFSCHAKGNILDFSVLMAGRNPKEGSDLRQTAIELAKRYSIQHVGSEQKSRREDGNGVSHARGSNPAPQRPPKAAQSAPPKATIVNAPLGFTLQDLDGNHPYLLERGLTKETITQFGLGFCKKGRLTGRIAIPIHDRDGKLIAYAGRLVDEGQISAERPKYLFPGSRAYQNQTYEFKKSLVLYNAHRLKRPLPNLIVVEGFASVWWLTQCGFPNCAAVMGSSMSPEQAEMIRSLVGEKGTVTVLTDGDVPGMRCCDEIRATLGKSLTVHRPSLPIDAQPTDFTREELQTLLKMPDEPPKNRNRVLRRTADMFSD